jgi:protocatechuate 3,4-dioxygenase alpha subunit
MTHLVSPSQTIGPFSHEGWAWGVQASDECAALLAGTPTLTLSGIVRDGAGNVIDDAMIECWSPASAAVESALTVPGFRRAPTGIDGRYQFTLSRVAALPAGEPVAYITVFARGLVLHQFTAVFLEDDPGLASSPLLEQVPHARRATLIARRIGANAYAWDIAMQGENETVFFDYA